MQKMAIFAAMACWLLTNFGYPEVCGIPEMPTIKMKEIYLKEKPAINKARYVVWIPGQAEPEYWPVASTELKPVPEEKCQ